MYILRAIIHQDNETYETVFTQDYLIKRVWDIDEAIDRIKRIFNRLSPFSPLIINTKPIFLTNNIDFEILPATDLLETCYLSKYLLRQYDRNKDLFQLLSYHVPSENKQKIIIDILESFPEMNQI